MAALRPKMSKTCTSRLGRSGRIGFDQYATLIRAISAFCIWRGLQNHHQQRAGCARVLARRIGVRAQFGDAPLATSTASGRIGIRPQICYAAPVFDAGAKAGQLWSGGFRDANWLLPGRSELEQQAGAAAELFITQAGFHIDFCHAHAAVDAASELTTARLVPNCSHAVADLGSDPNSVRDLEICQRRSPELGSDPNSAGHPDSASVGVAQRNGRFAIKTNPAQVYFAIYFVSGSARCIRAGAQKSYASGEGCMPVLARRIGVRAQFGEAPLANSTAPGRIGIRPQICCSARDLSARAKRSSRCETRANHEGCTARDLCASANSGHRLSGRSCRVNWHLPGRLKSAAPVIAAASLSRPVHGSVTPTQQATS